MGPCHANSIGSRKGRLYMADLEVQCSYCGRKRCFFGDLSQAPEFCPTLIRNEQVEYSKARLSEPDNQVMAQAVARTWKDYGKLTRVEETVLYAKVRGYKKLGLAFCVGLSQEAEMFTNLLLNEGFEVVSVCCMNGGLSSDDVNLPPEDKIIPEMRQPMCNPIGQAAILDHEGAELNILLGLCVGDDTLFIKHSQAQIGRASCRERV